MLLSEIFLKFEIKKSYQDKSVCIYYISKCHDVIFGFSKRRREEKRVCLSIIFKKYCIRYHIFILSYLNIFNFAFYLTKQIFFFCVYNKNPTINLLNKSIFVCCTVVPHLITYYILIQYHNVSISILLYSYLLVL